MNYGNMKNFKWKDLKIGTKVVLLENLFGRHAKKGDIIMKTKYTDFVLNLTQNRRIAKPNLIYCDFYTNLHGVLEGNLDV